MTGPSGRIIFARRPAVVAKIPEPCLGVPFAIEMYRSACALHGKLKNATCDRCEVHGKQCVMSR